MGSNEWSYLWSWLEVHPINQNIDEPTLALNNGEGWQYMGTFKQGDKYIHNLRHRNHPITNDIKELCLTASKDFNPDTDIEKSFKLK